MAGALRAQPPEEMQPGEVYIHGPDGTQIYLKADGTLLLKGETVSIEGTLVVNGVLYPPCMQ